MKMQAKSLDSFNTQDQIKIGDKIFHLYNISKLNDSLKRLPFSLKVLLENLLLEHT